MLIVVGRIMMALAGLAFVFPTTGCVCTGDCHPAGPTEELVRTIDREDVESLVVEIDMGIGDLEIDGRADDDKVLDARFVYNVNEWKPIVDYDVRGGVGYLTIRQGESKCKVRGTLCDVENSWYISLSGDVPTSITVDTGVAETDLDLVGMRITDLSVDHGVGRMFINATGERNDDLDITIDGGVGSTRVLLPRSTGVRVDCETGIGSVTADSELHRRGSRYENEACGETEATIDVRIEAGIGSIELDMSS